MRLPSGSSAWKHINKTWPVFERKPHHLRLGLAMDDVNSFGLDLTKWSTLPIVLVNYNIPPWLFIKKDHLLLSLIIPSKKKVKSLLVYMASLIDELQDIWRGVKVVNNPS